MARTAAKEQESTPVVYDKVGQQITVGAFIAYGHALGRCAGIRIGKVLRIREKEKTWANNDSEVSITVWGVDDEWPGGYTTSLCKSRGTLLFPDRIVVLNEAVLPELYRTLLAPVTIDSTWKSLGSPEREYIRSK
jgi:hypothetical protein